MSAKLIWELKSALSRIVAPFFGHVSTLVIKRLRRDECKNSANSQLLF